MDFAAKALVVSMAAFGLFQASEVVAQTQPASNITYTYNAKGERISKNVDGVITRFVYDERGHLTSEISPTGSRDYIYLGDTLVSTVDTPTSNPSQSAVAYITTDHTETPRAVSDSNGTLIWQNPVKGNPWGEQPALSSGYALNVRSPGSYYDPETGLIYNTNRYLEPATGRFLEPDPIGMHGGVNPYAAVSNNPLNRIDPDGLRDIFVGGFFDGTSGIVQSYYNQYHTTHPDSAYYSWRDLDGIVADINKTDPSDPIHLIGHSYGGDTAAKAALRACGKVSLLITIDPVSRHGPDMSAIAAAVGTWVDVNAGGGSAFQGSNFIAGLGGAWNSDPYGVANAYIEDDTSTHQDFQHMMNAHGPNMSSPAQILGGAPLVSPPFINQ